MPRRVRNGLEYGLAGLGIGLEYGLAGLRMELEYGPAGLDSPIALRLEIGQKTHHKLIFNNARTSILPFRAPDPFFIFQDIVPKIL